MAWSYMGEAFRTEHELAWYMLKTGAVEESFGNWMYQEMCPYDVLYDCVEFGAQKTDDRYREMFSQVMVKGMKHGEDYMDDTGEYAFWFDEERARKLHRSYRKP